LVQLPFESLSLLVVEIARPMGQIQGTGPVAAPSDERARERERAPRLPIGRYRRCLAKRQRLLEYRNRRGGIVPGEEYLPLRQKRIRKIRMSGADHLLRSGPTLSRIGERGAEISALQMSFSDPIQRPCVS